MYFLPHCQENITMSTNEIQKRLAENLRRIRKEKKLTQFELAEKANISEPMLKCVELATSWPSEKTLLQLSKALKIDVYHFFLPVPSTVAQKEFINKKIRQAISVNLLEYVDDVLGKISRES